MLGTRTPSTQVNDQSTLILHSNNHLSLSEHGINCRPSMLKSIGFLPAQLHWLFPFQRVRKSTERFGGVFCVPLHSL